MKKNICFKSVSEMNFRDDFSFKDVTDEWRERNSLYEMAYSSIYEKEGRKSEYEFNSLVQRLGKLPKKIDYKDIYSLPLRNVKKIQGTDNSYRGQTLDSVEEKVIKKLSDFGIKTYVDLIEYPGLKEKVEKNDVNYYPCRMSGLWNGKGFESKKKYMEHQISLLKMISECGLNIDVEEGIKMAEEKFSKGAKNDIDKLVNFIKIMKGDNVYIACQYGTYETDVALMLNRAFNPKCANEKMIAESSDMLHKMENICLNMSESDKKDMGWTEDTEMKFWDRAAECEKSFFRM